MLARQLDAPDVDRLVGEAAFFLGLDVDHLAALDIPDGIECLGTLSLWHDRGWVWWCCMCGAQEEREVGGKPYEGDNIVDQLRQEGAHERKHRWVVPSSLVTLV